jgi:Short C-terminal domain
MKTMVQSRRATTGSSPAVELRQLAALHDRGAINDQEYTAAKRKLLSVPWAKRTAAGADGR